MATLNGPLIVGGMILSFAYGQIKEWRTVSVYFLLIPLVILLILVFLFFEDTPYSLLKSKTAKEISESLNRIGKINTGEDNLVSEEEIVVLLEEEAKIEKIQEHTNPLDLFRYPSLRVKSIAFTVYAFLISIAYFAQSMNIDKIGFNPTLNQLLMNIAELLHVPILLLTVSIVRRQISGFVTMSVCCFLSLATYFLLVPSNCELCLEVYIQMGLILVARLFLLYQYTIGIMNFESFYPLSIHSVALGLHGVILCLVMFHKWALTLF